VKDLDKFISSNNAKVSKDLTKIEKYKIALQLANQKN